MEVPGIFIRLTAQKAVDHTGPESFRQPFVTAAKDK
jgi:hypothetical protein